MADDTLTPGLFISGRFRLKRLLGRGGMGSVWAAHHLTLEKDVAIKFLEPKWSTSEDARRRFAQEAIAVARMKSPHVVTVLDYGFTDENRAFIVMELLHGEDLGQRLAQAKRLSLEQTRDIVTQTCRGLEKSHTLGVIHRDLKPENLFLSDEDGMVVKLLDFGVAKAVGMVAGSHITDTGQIVGTPLYMSPEQALGRLVDTRSDLYSLAVIAYRCLAGRLPFMDKPAGELIVALSTLTPPAPSGFVTGLPESLDRWFASMFRKDPDARCAQTAAELSATFAAACDGRFEDPGPSTPPSALSNATAPTLIAGRDALPVARVAGEARSASERRAPMTRHLVVVIALAVGAAVVSWRYMARKGRQAAAPIEAATHAERPAPPRTVDLRVIVSPPNASIFLDGVGVGGTPFVGARPSDDRPHQLRVEAPGHAPVEREIRLERDLQVDLFMSPLPAPAAPAEKAPTPPRARSPVERRAAEPRPAEPPAPTLLPPALAPPEPDVRKRRPLELDREPPWKGQ